MNPVFYPIYEQLYESFGDEFSGPPVPIPRQLARDVKQVIDQVIEELNLRERVRPDARHFLLVNFHQFIVAPAYLASPRLNINAAEVFDVLRDDTRTILRASEELSRERERGEISGHIVLDALSSRWDKLKSTFYEFWDC